MARRFLPALRGITTETQQLDVPESKVVFGVGGYSSTTSGGMRYGLENRAAAWDMEQVISTGYERGVWVFKSVEAISGHSSRLPFRIGRDLDNDEREVHLDHPLYRVLNKQANPLETGRQFRKRLSAQVLLSKRGAFVEVIKSRQGTVTRLDLLPPDRVRPMPSEHDGFTLSHFEYTTRQGEMREIEPERIRWVREPHPTDPFSGVTPLEAAGISVELDHLSRVYNVTFIQRDGRPGGIIGVDADGMEDAEMDRIERKFAPGAEHAGSMSVIGTGPGGIKYIDTAAKPRDMAYSEAAANSKLEILAAFGVPESILGNASARTYANAEQEAFNFWSEVMVPHLDLVAGAFDRDVDEEWDPFIDTSTVEVLELPRRLKREEAREEWKAGLISIDEYRPLTGREPFNSAHSRALWISPAKAPVPANPEDAAALGVKGPGEDAGAAPAVEGEPGAPVVAGETAVEAVERARALALEAGPSGAAAAVEAARVDTATAPGGAAAAVDAARSAGGTEPGGAADAVTAARMEGKAVDPGEYDPGEDASRRVEAAAAAVLDALLARQLGVLTARAESPKLRKGTRFWTPAGPEDARVGGDTLDVDQLFDEDRWVDETTATLDPLVQEAARDAAVTLLAAFAGGAAGAGAAGVGGAAAAGYAASAGQIGAVVSLGALTVAGEAMRAFLRDRSAAVARQLLLAGSIADVQDAVRGEWADHARAFADSLALTVAQVTVNGARDAAAETLTSPGGAGGPSWGGLGVAVGVVRTWRSRRDEKVRPTHARGTGVDGTTLPVGEPFTVGEALLRYPGDPFGPPGETRNCRCRLAYSTVRDTRAVPVMA